MNIQSLSIVIPTKGCVNHCKFCVSRMHESPYENKFDAIAIRKRIKYAANNGVNTLILTGTGEALQNIAFLSKLKQALDKEGHPFPNVELQTTGVMLTKDNMFLLKSLGVNTISLSVSDIFDSDNNWDIIGAPENLRQELYKITGAIEAAGFNLRLSLNMIAKYDEYSAGDIISSAAALGAQQITFRKLYHSGTGPESNWVRENACLDITIKRIEKYIRDNGTKLYKLPFGADVYSIASMSVAVDDDCMSKESNDQLKYVIIREDGKLYCRWDDYGSLIF